MMDHCDFRSSVYYDHVIVTAAYDLSYYDTQRACGGLHGHPRCRGSGQLARAGPEALRSIPRLGLGQVPPFA